MIAGKLERWCERLQVLMIIARPEGERDIQRPGRCVLAAPVRCQLISVASGLRSDSCSSVAYCSVKGRRVQGVEKIASSSPAMVTLSRTSKPRTFSKPAAVPVSQG